MQLLEPSEKVVPDLPGVACASKDGGRKGLLVPAARGEVVHRRFVFLHIVLIHPMTTTVENAFGNPSRVRCAKLKVFTFLNLSGLGETDVWVVSQRIMVVRGGALSVRRHFLFITSRASAYLCRKRIDERSVFKFVFAALETFLVTYTYIISTDTHVYIRIRHCWRFS